MAITNIYKGDIERSDIHKIYKGTTLLYEAGLPSRYIQTTTADLMQVVTILEQKNILYYQKISQVVTEYKI